MQLFQLIEPTTVTLQHVNLRSERHGKKERVRAIDLKVMLEGGNNLLALLHADLKSRFYYRDKETDDQQDIAGVEQILPNLFFKNMGELPWVLEMSGVDVSIVYGTGDARSNFDLVESKVKDFFVKMKEGGTVQIRWRISTSHVPDGALDKLSKQLDGPLEMTLVRNEKLIQQAVIDGTIGHPGVGQINGGEKPDEAGGDAKGKGKTGKGKAAKADATQQFIDANPSVAGGTPPLQ
jgi:hypothetical protein